MYIKVFFNNYTLDGRRNANFSIALSGSELNVNFNKLDTKVNCKSLSHKNDKEIFRHKSI